MVVSDAVHGARDAVHGARDAVHIGARDAVHIGARDAVHIGARHVVPLRGSQRVEQISLQILGIFKTDGETHQVVGAFSPITFCL